jgi:HAE1 family hydrophobic/amphiphilic exporter-1
MRNRIKQCSPLEEEINGVEGMTYMASTAANDGSANICLLWIGDPDIAAVNKTGSQSNQ